jgi:hypothetical protein
MKSWSITRSKGRKLDFAERPVKPVDYGRTQRPKELRRMALGLALAHPRAIAARTWNSGAQENEANARPGRS